MAQELCQGAFHQVTDLALLIELREGTQAFGSHRWRFHGLLSCIPCSSFCLVLCSPRQTYAAPITRLLQVGIHDASRRESAVTPHRSCYRFALYGFTPTAQTHSD